ncbi:MAG: FAD-dependent oxidoreductase, partial [Chloroflexi bacterium]|nr:FAD-dependent oxidoreductase [Chloroflexota bacterium]
MPFEVDIAIIGAGVVGLAIASELSQRHKGVFVFERNDAYGSETSSRNSEVIHAGIYYPQDSLKARLCVEGRHLLYEICSRHGIPHRRLGKIIVATSEQEVGQLEAIREKARHNGVGDLRPLSRAELKQLEPNVEARAGLLSPSTGIVSAHSLMDFFYKNACGNGADFIFGAEVIGLEPKGSAFTVRIRDS